MRYIELKDINDRPIFEGDVLVLTIKDKFFGGSYFGKFCSFYDIDEAKIRILNNSPYLQIKAIITFYKNGKQCVTNQENAYWEYYNGCLESSKIPEKELEDFLSVEDAKELSELKVEDSLFLRYLLSKGVEKVSGFSGEIPSIPEELFLIKTKLDKDIFVGDRVLVALNKEWRDKLVEDPRAEDCLIENFTHAVFEFEKMPEKFDYKINVFLTDEDSNCKVFLKSLDENGREKKERYKLFLGLKGEINLLNYFHREGFECNKVIQSLC